MEYIHELLGYENLKIIQKEDMFRFSLDSMLLGYFANVKSEDKVVDLGCGNGPIPLFLSLKTKGQIYGIEIQSEVYDLARRSVLLNNLEKQISILNENIIDIYKIIGANSFDVVTTNPPYFKYSEDSNVNKSDYKTIARHEVLINLEQIIKESSKLLVDGGSLNIVHRVSRLSDLIYELNKCNFGVKRIQYVYPKINSKEALIMLIEAKKNRPSDVKVVKPLYVLDDIGKYTAEVLEIFNFKK
ncbi:MAG TPA: tRNA1(Val) (adenine(37)-N6)-methyltransferase [Acholeplasmataceae bacterium]|nr:tRNA1(Val) (adenine(37)-N6)-methyltransferase [Acholeplasmataceae bacterium]